MQTSGIIPGVLISTGVLMLFWESLTPDLAFISAGISILITEAIAKEMDRKKQARKQRDRLLG